MRSRPPSRLGSGLLAAAAALGWAASPGSATPPRAARSAPAARATGFLAELPAGLRVPSDGPSRQLLAAYGAMFVARGVALPPTLMFADAAACARWQAGVAQGRTTLAGVPVDLQARALAALEAAEREAEEHGRRIVPTGADAARRSYAETLALWRSRVNPGLDYWTARGRLSRERAARVRALPVAAQVEAILGLEAQRLYFSADRRKTILESVAPPGASQHIAMLALDIRNHGDPVVRAVLARHGWFQTVVSDAPHFTYLGVAAAALPALGLRRDIVGGREYWVPNLGPLAVVAVNR